MEEGGRQSFRFKGGKLHREQTMVKQHLHGGNAGRGKQEELERKEMKREKMEETAGN